MLHKINNNLTTHDISQIMEEYNYMYKTSVLTVQYKVFIFDHIIISQIASNFLW